MLQLFLPATVVIFLNVATFMMSAIGFTYLFYDFLDVLQLFCGVAAFSDTPVSDFL